MHIPWYSSVRLYFRRVALPKGNSEFVFFILEISQEMYTCMYLCLYACFKIHRYSYTYAENARVPPQGSDPTLEPYLLAAHMDVVPVDASKWTKDPWSGQVIPDPETGEHFVWGRGAIDDKLGVMVRK